MSISQRKDKLRHLLTMEFHFKLVKPMNEALCIGMDEFNNLVVAFKKASCRRLNTGQSQK